MASTSPTKSLPKDALVMQAILKDMGISDYEPRIINQMLEFTYRYVTDVLDDAKLYSTHSGKKSVDPDDVKLAVQYKMDHSYTSPPPKDLLLELARHKNNQPLPTIKPYVGPRLPPDRYCLTSTNYRLKSSKKAQPQATVTPRIQISTMSSATKRLVSANTSLGGNMGLVNSQTITMANKSSTPVISRPAMPTFRITSGAGSFAGTSMTNIAQLQSNPLKRKMDDNDDYDKL